MSNNKEEYIQKLLATTKRYASYNRELWKAVEKHCNPEQLKAVKKEEEEQFLSLPVYAECLCGRHPWHVLSPMTKMGKSVLLTGPPRTGSTRVHKTIEKILGKRDVLKTHRFFKDACPFLATSSITIFCVRNPFDSLYSYLRYQGRLEKDDLTLEEIDEMFEDCIPMTNLMKICTDKSLKRVLAPKLNTRIIFIRYEDYWGDDEKLIRYLEQIIQPNKEQKLTASEIEVIVKEISLENNYRLSSAGGDDKIHPDHVGSLRGAPGQGEQLPEKYKKYIIDKYSEFFASLGYNLRRKNEE